MPRLPSVVFNVAAHCNVVVAQAIQFAATAQPKGGSESICQMNLFALAGDI